MEVEENPTWMPVVAVALIDDSDRWLMQRRPSGKQHAGLWEFPGGKVERGETPANALVREIVEELGVTLSPEHLEPSGFAQTAAEDGQAPIVILLYTCRIWSGTPQALEGGTIDWFSPEQAAVLAKPPLDRALLRHLVVWTASRESSD